MSDTFDFQLDYSEPTTAAVDQWELVEAPRDWALASAKYRDMDSGLIVVLYRHGVINIWGGDEYWPASILDRMQSLKALGKMHFGEDWGE